MPRRGSKKTRGVWTCVRLQCTTHFGWVNMWTKVHHVAWKSLVRIFSLAPKLSELRRCILNQFFNFHDIFLGEPSSQLWCALSSVGQSLARVKIWRGSTPLRAEMQSPEKSTLWSIYTRLNNFFVYGPKYTNFFDPTWEGWCR